MALYAKELQHQKGQFLTYLLMQCNALTKLPFLSTQWLPPPPTPHTHLRIHKFELVF